MAGRQGGLTDSGVTNVEFHVEADKIQSPWIYLPQHETWIKVYFSVIKAQYLDTLLLNSLIEVTNKDMKIFQP